MKDSIASTLVLTLPEGTKGFVVYCDASRVGFMVCAYATWEGNRLCFYVLNVHEINYPTHYHKLVVVLFALKIWSLFTSMEPIFMSFRTIRVSHIFLPKRS